MGGKFQWDFQGPPRTWDPLMVSFPYYSHTTPNPESLKIWEACMGPAYHKGVPCPWGSLKIPLKIPWESQPGSRNESWGLETYGWSTNAPPGHVPPPRNSRPYSGLINQWFPLIRPY